MERTEVLIVGAGPTGLALAVDLARREIPTTVVERRSQPATTSRAFALHARGLEILEDLGAGAVVLDTTPVTGATMHAHGHPLARVRFGGLARHGHPGIYLVSQARIEQALRDRLAELDAGVRFGHELIAATDHGDHVTATLRRAADDAATEQLQANWVIGADGARSTVRDLAGIPFDGNLVAESFLLADLELTTPFDAREIATFLHPDGLMGLFPLPEPGTWRLIAEAGHLDELPDDEDGVVELAQRVLDERTGRGDVRAKGASWWTRFRIHRRLAARYRSGRFLLAGDAAHEHSPFGGQGMNVGLGDATNLGWKLAMHVRGESGLTLLDSYEQERRAVAAEVVGFTTSATRAAIGSHPVARAVRDRVLPAIAGARADRPTFAVTPPQVALERFAQLRVRYRSGPLTAPLDGPAGLLARLRPGPQPGDRAPDAPILVHPGTTAANGRAHRTTLRQLFRGEWALLLLGPPSLEQRDAIAALARHLAEVAILRVLPTRATAVIERWRGEADVGSIVEDPRGLLHANYRPRGSTSVLVRPDGHIGWRSSWPTEPLENWLARALHGRIDTAAAQRGHPNGR